MDPDVPVGETKELIVSATAGDGPAIAAQTIQVEGTVIGEAFVQRTAGRFDGFDLAGDGREAGPALVLPLRATNTVAGVLVALRHAGAEPFTDDQLDMMAAFADQAALAWQLASTQRQMRELSILTDRDRIARDLHDHVIQRLFAVGLALQGTIPRSRVPEVKQRLVGCVDDLQEVIHEIRTAIFDLHGSSSGVTRLRQRLDEAIAQFAGAELRTSVQYVGPLSVVDTELADHAEAVVREAVSNAVRHADASSITVNVVVDDELSIEISDDGCGIPADVTGSGLTNLRRRAEDAGGSFTVKNAPGGGTVLKWTAPLP